MSSWLNLLRVYRSTNGSAAASRVTCRGQQRVPSWCSLTRDFTHARTRMHHWLWRQLHEEFGVLFTRRRFNRQTISLPQEEEKQNYHVQIYRHWVIFNSICCYSVCKYILLYICLRCALRFLNLILLIINYIIYAILILLLTILRIGTLLLLLLRTVKVLI